MNLNQFGPQVLLAFVAWVPILLFLFVVLPSRRAVIVGFIFAWLFLPVATYEFKGFMDLDKVTATCLLIFLATLFFDINRVLSFRLNWLDVPMIVFCICPFIASIVNNLGIYDGFSEFRIQLFHWGFPYFIGRLYFSELKGMRELAIGIVIGGLVYVPLLLFELRMSPQLHRIVYGFMQHSFGQTIRYGGWRPMVFLEHGLMVGMWMTSATLCAFAFWQMERIRIVDYAPSFTFGQKLRNIRWPMWTVVALLFVVTVLCKSTFAIVLLLVGMAALMGVKWFRLWHVVPLLSMVIIGYVVVRALGLWDGQELVRTSNAIFGADRAESIAYRLFNENILSARGREKLLFGWGGWGRSRVYDEWGKQYVTDSSWVIYLGTTGLLGVISFQLALLLPAVMLRFRIPPKYWTHPKAMPAVLFAVTLTLWMLDNTMNNMFNPVFVLMAGGLAGLKKQLVPEDIAVQAVRRPAAHAMRRKRKAVPAPAAWQGTVLLACLIGVGFSARAEVTESKQYEAVRHDFMVEGHRAFLILPAAPATDGSHPWIWYAPTFIGQHPDESHTWMAKQWLAAGFAIGGVEVGESYGSPDGVKAYNAYYDHVRKEYQLDEKPCLLAQSRGGLMLTNWAAANADHVQCIAAIYPVFNLESYPGLDKAAPAYGLTEQALRDELAEYNPIDRLQPLAKAKVPVLCIHGDSDAVVPVDRNSAILVERLKAAASPAELILIPGKGHEVCDEFFKSQAIVDFVLNKGLR